MSNSDRTQIVASSNELDLIAGDCVHCLDQIDCLDVGRRHVVGPLGLSVGRTPPADIVLSDSDVSRSHCSISLEQDRLLVSDLNSTNGTFIDGQRIHGSAHLPIGSVLRVGNRSLRHEVRTREELEEAEDLDRELKRASNYVHSLLPPPMNEGPIRCDWVHVPCAHLGGDAFGYGRIGDDRFIAYLIDVCGHGVGAAMMAVAVTNELRQHALPACDMQCPAAILTTLNRLFQMDEQDGMFFTMWCGVYDMRSRTLEYASAGHHAAFLRAPGDPNCIHVGNRNPMIGAVPDLVYKKASVEVPAGANMYLFSDGVFEIRDKAGRQWSIDDFERLVLQPPTNGEGEPKRLFRAVREAAHAGPLDDDFSLIVANFE